MNESLLARLKAQQLNAINAQRALLDSVEAEGRDLSGEEKATFEKTNEDYDARSAHIKQIEATEARMAAYDKAVEGIPGVNPDTARRSDAEQLRAMARGEVRSFDFVAPSAEERLANTKGSNAAGAYIVPTGFYPSLFESLVEASAVMAAQATIMSTASGANMQLPLSATLPTAALLTEGSAISASDSTFGQTTISAYKYGHTTQVSSELLADEGVDIVEFLSRRGGEALGNGIGAAFINGTGSSQPTGIAGSAGFTTVASASGSAAAGFTYQDVLTLQHSITRPYRVGASFICNDSVVKTLRSLRDSQGRYLWEPSLVLGAPETLAGAPIYTEPAMLSTTATTSKGLAYGNWKRGVVVRIAGGVRVDSSSDFAFSSDLVTFRFTVRADSRIVDTNAARVLTYLT